MISFLFIIFLIGMPFNSISTNIKMCDNNLYYYGKSVFPMTPISESLLHIQPEPPCIPITNKWECKCIENKFKHNFCESRLQNGNGPELVNAYTAFFVSAVPYFSGYPRYPPYYNVACLLMFNGFASFYYHYYLNWIGKQADEISMILANYYGINGMINMYYRNVDDRNSINSYNLIFMCLFIVFNSISKNDVFFSFIFGIYVSYSLFLIRINAIKYKVPYKRYIFISFLGFVAWLISEIKCNEDTQYGHAVWHLFFPLGLYRLIMQYDKIKRT